MPLQDARSLLAKFGLESDAVARDARSLSPGERTRASLALLMAGASNWLVLDEPTNHLDLPAIEQLESALDTFDGTLLLVTHDRRLLEAVKLDRTIELGAGSPGMSLIDVLPHEEVPEDEVSRGVRRVDLGSRASRSTSIRRRRRSQPIPGNNVILATPTAREVARRDRWPTSWRWPRARVTHDMAPIKAWCPRSSWRSATSSGQERRHDHRPMRRSTRRPDHLLYGRDLANIALREGDTMAEAGQVVMDEFHFDVDPQRGWAWQVPRLTLPQAQFLPMSATLGDMKRAARGPPCAARGARRR